MNNITPPKKLNGAARCFHSYKHFHPGDQEFIIHQLKNGIPICGFETTYNFELMNVKIDQIKDWKKCPKCFIPIKK